MSYCPLTGSWGNPFFIWEDVDTHKGSESNVGPELISALEPGGNVDASLWFCPQRSCHIRPSQSVCQWQVTSSLNLSFLICQMEQTWGPAMGEPQHMQVLYTGNTA